jgi:eukaryotic-like serine/threonine-protein kinase
MTRMPATFIDRETFLSNLRQSGLVESAQLEKVVAQLPETNRGRVIARELVAHGLLTKFQAEMLLAGRTSGFQLGQYRILDQLGQGGMGRVFKAIHVTMNRIVALKVVTSQLVKTEQGRQLFMREVRAAARLMHPNIVTAYDANQIGDRHYMVMEFVDGPNLEQLVREKGPLPVGQACDFIRQAASGLQFALENHMVHRDIKPANLLVQRAGGSARDTQCVVKILDFGLARLHQRNPNNPNDEPGSNTILTKENSVMGTPDYVSPEQARDLHSVDIRSDLYSLGCTFYYLLTGQVPFPGGSTLEKLVRHGTEEVMPITELRSDVPHAVAGIVRRLMAKQPAERFQTPAELAAALAPFAVNSPGTWSDPDSSQTLFDIKELAGEEERQPMAVFHGEDATSALIGTLPSSLSQTPLSTEEMPSMQLRRSFEREQRGRLIFALMVGLGLAACLGLIVLILALS